MPHPSLADLRRYAIARTLFAPTTLRRAVAKLGFLQADPIRAPARAQDLTLRHRVAGYHAGDLERHYPRLGLEEDFFVNYGFLRREHQALMHPRTPRMAWSDERWTQARSVLEFVRQQRGGAHPREVDAHFSHGKVLNWFGGSSNASTELLDGLHYRGLLRVARRDGGVRVYAAREPWPEAADAAGCQARMDALVDLVVDTYAPLPAASLGRLVSALRSAAPQWADDRRRALSHARQRLRSERIGGVDWYWPAGDDPASRRHRTDDQVRLLAPFDPVVWDRHRFELFWGWPYRFEAYTAAPRRKLGYYALPLLWRDTVVGWGNLSAPRSGLRPARPPRGSSEVAKPHSLESARGGMLVAEIGFVAAHADARDQAGFETALDAELASMARFLGLGDAAFRIIA